MCLESATENRQTVCFSDWGWKIVPDNWYGWTESTAAICSSGTWYLEQRTSWWAQCHRWTRVLTGDQLMKVFRLRSRLYLFGLLQHFWLCMVRIIWIWQTPEVSIWLPYFGHFSTSTLVGYRLCQTHRCPMPVRRHWSGFEPRLSSIAVENATIGWRDSIVVSVLDRRLLGRRFESCWLRAVTWQPWASCSLHPGPGLTQPSIIQGW